MWLGFRRVLFRSLPSRHVALALPLLLLLGATLRCGSSDFAAGGNRTSPSSGKSTDKADDDDDTQGDGKGGKDGTAGGKDGDTSTNGSDDNGGNSADPISVLDDGRIRERFVGKAQAETQPVDIVFAMDTSGSMSGEKAFLQTSMSKFVAKFETDAKGTDYQIYMIGENFQFPSDATGHITLNPMSSSDIIASVAPKLKGLDVLKKTVRVPLDWKPDPKALEALVSARLEELG